METVQMTIGGRPMLLSIKQADHVRRVEEKNRIRAREIERELKQERLGPATPHNQFVGWQGTNEIQHNKPLGLLVKSSEEKFQEFLTQTRNKVVAFNHSL